MQSLHMSRAKPVAIKYTAEYLPRGHCVHSPVPTFVLNFPASHATHVSPSARAVNPALQEQLAEEMEPLGDTAPWGQGRQVDDALPPMAPEYFAAGHTMHSDAPTISLKVPAGQGAHDSPV